MAYALRLDAHENQMPAVRRELQRLAGVLRDINRTFVVCQDGIETLKVFWEETMPPNVKALDPRGQTKAGYLTVDEVEYQVGWEPLYATLPGERRDITPTEGCILQLIACLRRNAELHEVVRSMKADPAIQFGFIEYLGKAYFAMTQRCKTLEQYIMLIGYRELEKWVGSFLVWRTVLNVMPDLHRTAIIRARQMERFAQIEGHGKEMSDLAYLVGVLSMMPTLLGVSKESVLRYFPPEDPLALAIQHKQGPVGRYLAYVKAAERGDDPEMRRLLAEGRITAGEANYAMLEGIKFAESTS